MDAIGTEEEAGTVVLSIFDSWDWTDEQAHLEALQAKINAYFAFIESGQLLDAYPAADNRHLRIDIATKYQLADSGIDLLHRAMKAAEAAWCKYHGQASWLKRTLSKKGKPKRR